MTLTRTQWFLFVGFALNLGAFVPFLVEESLVPLLASLSALAALAQQLLGLVVGDVDHPDVHPMQRSVDTRGVDENHLSQVVTRVVLHANDTVTSSLRLVRDDR